MWDEDHQIPMITETVNGLLLLQGCCKRAYIRGAFLAGGSISDPNKSYHLRLCVELCHRQNSFGIP